MRDETTGQAQPTKGWKPGNPKWKPQVETPIFCVELEILRD
ncbi:hypothetical protein PANO111632_13140 [Paracoccus nototheniae]